ncbi:MAG: hypothetical protein JEZ04_15885 [Spirochaetales bacterium]|nr:hypothetical protein [Spirochaetales bacterium]
MKKKILSCLVILIVSITGLSAGDIGFAFEDARFHSDYLAGFAPLYLRVGVDYSGLELLEGQKTNLYVIGGGALISSSLWTNSLGRPITPSIDNTTDVFNDLNSYSKWQGDLSLKLKQGLIQEEGREDEKAFFAVYGKYGFHLTSPHENADGSQSIFLSGSNSAYPDNAGTLSNILQVGFEIDRLDQGDVYNGFNVDGSVIYGPSWLLNTLNGTTDFVSVNLTAQGYLSLLDLKRENSELELVGIYLANRIRADYTTGAAIPQFYQEDPAMGSKIRGFEGNSLGTEFSIVNNLDIRVYGIEFIDNINPVFIAFFDAGYFAGNYYNTQYPGSGFLCSAGFQIALNIIDFAQIGYSFEFPLVGSNMVEAPMLSSLMLMYKF